MSQELLKRVAFLAAAAALLGLFLFVFSLRLSTVGAFHAEGVAPDEKAGVSDTQQEKLPSPVRSTTAPDKKNLNAKDGRAMSALEQATLPKIAETSENPSAVAESEGRYCLRVFLEEQMTAVFSPDESGAFTKMERLFPCSSGYYEGHTPLGQFQIGIKSNPSWLFDGSVAQYSSQITGPILFHSLPSYSGSSHTGISREEFNSLGYAVSHGCVRLLCQDAKWIFDHCPSGTQVEILANRGEAYADLPERMPLFKLKEGCPDWDPTDPDPANPYHDRSVLERWLVRADEAFDFTPKLPVWPEFAVHTAATEEERGALAAPSLGGGLTEAKDNIIVGSPRPSYGYGGTGYQTLVTDSAAGTVPSGSESSVPLNTEKREDVVGAP